MKTFRMLLPLAIILAVAVSMSAQDIHSSGNAHVKMFPTKARFNQELNNGPSKNAGGGGAGGNLVYHNGPTITRARLVLIFWGPNWSSGGDANIVTTLNNYANNFGTSGEYNVITQYSGIQLNSLLENTWVDTSTPPTNATDAAIQGEVQKYINSFGYDANAIYEVFLPSGSYSSNGSSTSCGGPNLQYCAYHGNFSSSAGNTRYASMPYPSCGGCQSAGFNTAQNFEHFVSHETREAVTDPDGTGWWDRRGYEADDKCAWSPTPFIDSATGFAYQYEWSNANSGCVKTR